MFDELTEASTISYLVPFRTTGNICLKSPPKTTVIPPKGLNSFRGSFLDMISRNDQSAASKHHRCIIGASSQIINFAARTRYSLGLSFSIVSDDASLISIGLSVSSVRFFHLVIEEHLYRLMEHSIQLTPSI
jgi:hypothetical protein